MLFVFIKIWAWLIDARNLFHISACNCYFTQRVDRKHVYLSEMRCLYKSQRFYRKNFLYFERCIYDQRYDNGLSTIWTAVILQTTKNNFENSIRNQQFCFIMELEFGVCLIYEALAW